MKSYYDIDGYKDIYGKDQLIYIMSLGLYYNSPGGFDKCLSQFEEICNKMEACDQGLTGSHKRTFFLEGIKDYEFEIIKDICDNNSFH